MIGAIVAARRFVRPKTTLRHARDKRLRMRLVARRGGA
jgi:hypothetical protein